MIRGPVPSSGAERRAHGISAVIPVYCSAEILGGVVDELDAALADLVGTHEIILVDDGSSDDSWSVVMEAAHRHPGTVRGIRLMRNFGQHNALLAGIRAARHPLIVTMDDDGQNPPAEIGPMLDQLHRGFDVVYGVPRQEKHSTFRALASRATKVALQEGLGGGRSVRDVSAFRVFHTRLRDAFNAYQSPFVSIDVLLTWGTTSFAAVTVEQRPRRSGTSTYTFRRLVTHALNMITGFSTRPLQLASIIGFAFTLLGLVILGYVLLRYALQGGTVPGFTFLAALVSLFSGAQLFALGVLGEYLARMHFRLMERPAYVILDSTPGASSVGRPREADRDRASQR